MGFFDPDDAYAKQQALTKQEEHIANCAECQADPLYAAEFLED
jgi:hypothetical protein